MNNPILRPKPHNNYFCLANAGSPPSGFQVSSFHRLLWPLILVIGGFLFSLPSYAQNKRLALVIGNADYKTNKLANPVHDAEDMTKKLKSLNFDVMHYSNLDRHGMLNAVQDFADKAASYDVILFYYAGHGTQVDGENFLIPVDTEFTGARKAVFISDSVNANMVLDMMSKAPNKTNLFFLDACRDNPFRSVSRSMQRGLAPMGQATGTLVAYATAPGLTARDGEGRNGIYTKHLLNYIDKPGLTIENMLKAVRKDVLQATADEQTPWENSSLRGDFCFAGCENPDLIEAQKAKAKIEADKNKAIQEAERIKAENEALVQQIAELRKTHDAERLANQDRLQKLDEIARQKAALEAQLTTEQQSLAAQKKLQQQLQALQAEKQQLEAKLSDSQKILTTNKQTDAKHAANLTDINAQLTAQIAEISQTLAAEKRENQQRLQKLADIERDKQALQARINTKKTSQATDQALQQQIQALQIEKQQLEAKISADTKKNTDNQQTLTELKRVKQENERLKSSLSTAMSASSESPDSANMTRSTTFQIGGF